MRNSQEPTDHSLIGREIIPQQQIIGLIQSTDPFPIDFEIAWKWCGYSRKDNAKRVLISNFTQSVDFHQILQKEDVAKRPQGGGIQGYKIMLSIDCFKAFSMMAGTDKGKEVRAYFIACEKELLEIKNQSKEEVIMKKQLAMRVKRLRKSNNFNQTQVGELLGKGPTAYAAKEQLITTFSVLELRKIKSRFNTTYDYLIDGDENRISSGAIVNASIYEELRDKHIILQEKVISIQEKLILSLEGKTIETKEPVDKYFTILAYAIKNHISLNKKEATKLGQKAASLCKERDIEIKKVSNETYGEIGSYPLTILKEVFTLNN